MIVYRGQSDYRGSDKIQYNQYWHSASKSKDIAVEFSTKKACCVFTIHLVDIPVIDINDLIGDTIGEHTREKEVIFLGGGTFYKDAGLTTQGFLATKDGEYECWYSMVKRVEPTFDVDIWVDALRDEFASGMIQSSDDVVDPKDKLTPEQKQLIFGRLKGTGGLRRKTRKQRTKRTRTKRTKRTKRTRTKRHLNSGTS